MKTWFLKWLPMLLVAFGSIAAVSAEAVKEHSVKKAPKSKNDNGYWVTAYVVKAGTGSSNPVITLRLQNGDYSYQVGGCNANQILNLAVQALVNGKCVQAYVSDSGCYGGNGYMSALYIKADNNPPPPPQSFDEVSSQESENLK